LERVLTLHNLKVTIGVAFQVFLDRNCFRAIGFLAETLPEPNACCNLFCFI